MDGLLYNFGNNRNFRSRPEIGRVRRITRFVDRVNEGVLPNPSIDALSREEAAIQEHLSDRVKWHSNHRLHNAHVALAVGRCHIDTGHDRACSQRRQCRGAGANTWPEVVTHRDLVMLCLLEKIEIPSLMEARKMSPSFYHDCVTLPFHMPIFD